jgi:hypothetical protein
VKPTIDDIRDLLEEWEATLPPDEFRERVRATIETMAVGDPGRAELLAHLGTELQPVATEHSLELVRAAVDDGGPTTIDARVELLRVLYWLDRQPEADKLARELLRAQPRDGVAVGLHASLGEVLELAERIREAHRAYTVGLKEFDPELDEPTMDEDVCLAGRYRVRRSLGMGTDALDRCLEELAPTAAASIRARTVADVPDTP